MRKRTQMATFLLILSGALIGLGLFVVGLVVQSWLSIAASLPKPGDWPEEPPERALFRNFVRSWWARGVGAVQRVIAARGFWRRA